MTEYRRRRWWWLGVEVATSRVRERTKALHSYLLDLYCKDLYRITFGAYSARLYQHAIIPAHHADIAHTLRATSPPFVVVVVSAPNMCKMLLNTWFCQTVSLLYKRQRVCSGEIDAAANIYIYNIVVVLSYVCHTIEWKETGILNYCTSIYISIEKIFTPCISIRKYLCYGFISQSILPEWDLIITQIYTLFFYICRAYLSWLYEMKRKIDRHNEEEKKTRRRHGRTLSAFNVAVVVEFIIIFDCIVHTQYMFYFVEVVAYNETIRCPSWR